MKTRTSKTKSSKIWCILVDHEFQKQVGVHFSVQTSSEDDIDDLKDKVKVKLPTRLTHVSSPDLTVWKTKGEMIINSAEVKEPKRLVEILGNINVDNEDAIEMLDPVEQVADLGLTDGQFLLVQLPGTSRISTVVRCFLR